MNDKVDHQNQMTVFLSHSLVQERYVTNQLSLTSHQHTQLIGQINGKLDQAIVFLNHSLVQQSQGIRQLSENFSQQNQVLLNLNQSLVEESQTTNQLSQTLGQLDQSIRLLNDKSDRQNLFTMTLNETIEQVNNKIDQHSQDFGFFNHSLVQQSQSIRRVIESFSQQNQVLLYLNETLVEESQTTNQLSQTLGRLDQSIRLLNDKSDRQNLFTMTLNETLGQVNNKIDQKNRDFVSLNHSLVQHFQTIAQIIESFSQQNHVLVYLNQTLAQELNVTNDIGQTLGQQNHVIRQLDEKFDQQNQIVVDLNQSLIELELLVSNQILQTIGQQQTTLQHVTDLLQQIGQAGRCYAIRPTVQHATQSIQQTTNGTVLTYTCHLGYKFISGRTTSSTTCDGFSWTPIDSSCIQTHCSRLTIPNAELTAYNTSYKSKVNVTCVSGYQVSDNLTTTVLTCQANGTWSLPTMTPVCKRTVLRPSLAHIIPGDRTVQALASFNNRLFVTREPSYSQIEVYDITTFERIRYITVHGASDELPGLVPCPTYNNCLYVSDHNNRKVHKVNLSLTSGDFTATNWSVNSPRGLSVNRQQNLLVAFGNGRKIEEYTPTGSLVRQISDSNNMWHAVEHINGTLAVSRYYPVHGICLMSVDGQVLRSYGNRTQGSGPGMMNDPSSLAVDKDGFILVADQGNHRILVLNPTLSEARPLPLPLNATGQINYPQGLWFDESRGRLYVGEAGPPHRVLVFDNVFNLGAVFLP